MRQLSIREKLFEIIFEAHTPKGKLFDVVLIFLILFSVGLAILESVPDIQKNYGGLVLKLEWIITILFTTEYLTRVYCINKPKQYIFSFYGLVDFFSILPTYLELLLPGTHYLSILRILRVLRVFRVLKLVQYLAEARMLSMALKASRRKITVFLFFVACIVTIIGALMYLIEGEESGFSHIPMAMYWAIVTLTTVGYGDFVPQTGLGKLLSCVIMILGYGVLAVPTGIVSVEMAKVNKTSFNTRGCRHCGREGHDTEANFCYQCGEKIKD